jgi:hypothetical protein
MPQRPFHEFLSYFTTKNASNAWRDARDTKSHKCDNVTFWWQSRKKKKWNWIELPLLLVGVMEIHQYTAPFPQKERNVLGMREVSENDGPVASRLLDELMASSLSLAKRSWRVTATVSDAMRVLNTWIYTRPKRIGQSRHWKVKFANLIVWPAMEDFLLCAGGILQIIGNRPQDLGNFFAVWEANQSIWCDWYLDIDESPLLLRFPPICIHPFFTCLVWLILDEMKLAQLKSYRYRPFQT